MGKYRIRPNDVEAEKFTGSSNWAVIERWLGPHLTKEEGNPRDRSDVAYSVYDIASKAWKLVIPNSYVVRFPDGAVSVIAVKDFESQWEPVPPVTRDWGTTPIFPTLPQPSYPPFRATFGNDEIG